MRARIVGAGAQGRVIADILRMQECYENIEFVDDSPTLIGTRVNGILVAAGVEEALQSDEGYGMIVALGNPANRLAMAARIDQQGVPLINAIHSSAVIMPSATLGRGIMVGANAVINSNAQIRDNVIVNTGAIIEHDCQVSEGAAVGPSAHLGGRATIGTCSFIATGAIVLSRVSIGEQTVVGAGALVTRDLPDRVLAFGIPAKVKEKLDSNFEWSRVL